MGADRFSSPGPGACVNYLCNTIDGHLEAVQRDDRLLMADEIYIFRNGHIL